MKIRNMKNSIVFIVALLFFTTQIHANEFGKNDSTKHGIKIPIMYHDPLLPKNYIVMTHFKSNPLIDFDTYIPFGFAVEKKLLKFKHSVLFGDAGVHTQFGWRNEKNAYMNGLRKTCLNNDYVLALNYAGQLLPNWYYRVRLYHRSSHLGDDYILMNNVKAKNYWKDDPTNYEELDATLMKKFKHGVAYTSIGSVVRLDTPRKRARLAFGGYFNSEDKRYWRLLAGTHIEILANNDYKPAVKSGVGVFMDKRKKTLFQIEYFQGNLPYSRFETQVNTNWIGVGCYVYY